MIFQTFSKLWFSKGEAWGEGRRCPPGDWQMDPMVIHTISFAPAIRQIMPSVVSRQDLRHARSPFKARAAL